MNSEQSGRPVLTFAELQAFDPQAPANRCWCPLCGQEKPKDNAHRSLSFDRSTGKWKCFRCGAGGTLREFWQEKSLGFQSRAGQGRRGLRASFSPASSPAPSLPPRGIVAAGASVHASAAPESTQNEAWREKWEATWPLGDTPGAEYLLRRGIPLEVAQWAEVRYSADWNAVAPALPEATPGGEQGEAKARRAMEAVVFPIREQAGSIVAAQARAIWGNAKLTAGPKKEGAFFAPVQMKSGRVFGPLDRGTPVVTITEAPIDALSLACAGFPAIALCGTSGPSWLHIACGLRRVALALDADEAGERAAAELTQLLSPFGAHCVRLKPEGAKDWNEMLLRVGASELGNFLTPHLL